MSIKSIGSIKDYTPNFNFIIPKFDIATWHDYMEKNFRSIDALFYNLFGINNYSGEWTQLTQYKTDQVLFIGEDKKDGEDTEYTGRLVKVLQDHTTDNSEYFNLYFEKHPEYYELFADASTAQTFALQAQQSAANALQSETKAKESETNSKSSEQIATQKASEALNSANNAKNSEDNALNSKNSAISSAQFAQNTVNGFDTHVAEKQNIFDLHVVEKTDAFNQNYTEKLESFNTNYTDKTNIFNTNATQKQEQIDISANNAKQSEISATNEANIAESWAIGDISSRPEGSAKYWAEQSSKGQKQVDWNQSDNTQVDFIKNKPTALSQFTNDTNFVNTTQLATKQDVSNLSQTVDSSTTLYPSNKAVVDYSAKRHQVVSVLPVNPDANTFYYIPEE